MTEDSSDDLPIEDGNLLDLIIMKGSDYWNNLEDSTKKKRIQLQNRNLSYNVFRKIQTERVWFERLDIKIRSACEYCPEDLKDPKYIPRQLDLTRLRGRSIQMPTSDSLDKTSSDKRSQAQTKEPIKSSSLDREMASKPIRDVPDSKVDFRAEIEQLKLRIEQLEGERALQECVNINWDRKYSVLERQVERQNLLIKELRQDLLEAQTQLNSIPEQFMIKLQQTQEHTLRIALTNLFKELHPIKSSN